MDKKKKYSHLTAFLGNACNLNCSYCYLRTAGRQKIKERNFLSAIIYFIKNSPEDRKITFLGGEPLCNPLLFKKAVMIARKIAPDIPLRLFTNGTLLTRELLDFINSRGIELSISLDGKKECNDFSRKFRNSEGSVFDAVTEKLPAEKRAGATVGIVVRPDTAELLTDNIEALLELGFRNIGWTPDITAMWTEEDIFRLESAAADLYGIYIKELKKKRVLFTVANIYETLEDILSEEREDGCGSLTLDCSGKFYPCDKLLCATVKTRNRYRIRRERDGFSQTGSKQFFAAARRDGTEPARTACPVGPWAVSKFSRIEGTGGKEFMAGQLLLCKIVRNWLASIASEGIRYKEFLHAHNMEQ